ncbi:MAG: hypothetical protein JXD22_05795 [Sedimentisphaerales bacterium]|nr:hypothetical protein [Sedimentisphaerales bacterium]
MINILPLLVAIPLGAAFLLPLLEKFPAGPRLSRTLAVITSAALMALSLLFLTADNITYWMGGWTPDSGALGICLVLDHLSAFMLALVALVTLVATLFSLSYMKRYTAEPLYYCLFFLMVTGMNGVILAGDIFNLYVFLEVAAIASYSLVAFGCGSEELEASFKYLVLGTVGSVFILLGIAIVYNQTGQLNLAAIANTLPQQNAALSMAAAFFLVGFSLKAAMVPFHAWLPDAHPSAPAPISAMLSGILIKVLGIYALVRVFFDTLEMSQQFAYILITLGAVSMVIGVFLAVGQWDFKRLLAYHSISQMGYVVLAFGVAGEMLLTQKFNIASLALLGGLFHLFNHAVFKSLLFLCSGAAEYATGTRLLKKLGGLKHRMPVTSSCLRIAALSISGVPPFNGFWSKLIIIIATIQAGHLWLGAMTVLVSFMTLLSFIKVQRYIVDGDPSVSVSSAKEVPFSMCLAMVILAIICIGAGILLPLYQKIFSDGAQSVITEQFTQLVRLAGG